MSGGENMKFKHCPTCGKTIVSKTQLIKGVCAKCNDEFLDMRLKNEAEKQLKKEVENVR